MEPRGLTHLHEVFGRDDVATDDEIFGNVAESKSPTVTSPSDKLYPILLEAFSELDKVVKSHEYSTQRVNMRFITTMFLNT